MDEIKGPWSYVYRDNGNYGQGEVVDSEGKFVAMTTGPNWGAWHEDESLHFEKIARLISSAPELLEALILCDRVFRSLGLIAAADEPHPGSLGSTIKAAIAKATGESA